MTRATVASGLVVVALGCLTLLDSSDPANARVAAREAATKAHVSPLARYVSPRGSDRNPGTLARPWRTIGKALARLRPGETAYLRAGDYVEAASGACSTSFNALTWARNGQPGKPITLAGYPPERGRAIVRTQLKIRGEHLRLVGLVFERNRAYSTVDGGCTGAQAITLRGADLQLTGLEVRNANMSGLYMREADGVRINRCSIRDNGTHAGQDHGIYVSASTNLLVSNSVIDNNAGYGIHMYPDTSEGARIIQNTVVRNGSSGLILAGDSRNNVIANNIFAFNGEYGAREHRTLNGTDNRLTHNLFHGNSVGDISFPDENVTIDAAFSGAPDFVNLEAGDLRIGRKSAALNRAMPELSRARDYRGRKRPQGRAADLGAFER